MTCKVCNNTRKTHLFDNVYGPCMNCCCLYCEKLINKCECKCKECNDKKTVYWSDDVYGPCLNCCCVDCEKLFENCECQNED